MCLLAGVLAATLLACRHAAPPAPRARSAGTLLRAKAYSAVLGESVQFQVYLPPGYAAGTRRYPVVYLLHGRDDTMRAWDRVVLELDQRIASGQLPPFIAVMPDAPWSRRASWYVDSQFESEESPGRAVETALTEDLASAVDATYRTVPEREGRFVAGYSMGGYGALRYALAHPERYAGALVLSPAVYVPVPPRHSSSRDHGAFGSGEQPFDARIYRALGYPTLLASLDPARPMRVFIAAGDDEYKAPGRRNRAHDVDVECAKLFGRLRRTPGVSAELRILDGGHDWSVWQPAFMQGLEYLLRTPEKERGPPLTRARGRTSP